MKSDLLKLPVRPDMVWLDLDDTLIDFKANSRKALRLLYSRATLHRYIPSADRWIEDYEESNHELWRRYALGEITRDFLRIERMRAPLRPFWTDSDKELDSLALNLDPLYLDLLAGQKGLVDGARELLESLRSRGYRIGVLSNGFKQVQFRKMESAGLSDMIDIVVLSDDIGVNKPALGIYRHAMEVAGVMNPGRNLLVGDNPDTDIAGALNAGWDAILFDPGLGVTVQLRDGAIATGSLSTVAEIIP